MIKAYFVLGVEDISVPLSIRTKVFVDEQGFSLASENDDFDSRALHVIISDDDVPCATGRLYFANGVWNIGRVCVLSEKRALHLGDLVMRSLLDQAVHYGASEIRVDAQRQAQGFYEKLGFAVCGPEHDDEGVPHVPMSISSSKVSEFVFGGCGGDCKSCGKCG